MTKIERVYQAMRAYNGQAAPGSESRAYQDFVFCCDTEYGGAPWDLITDGRDCDDVFFSYWTYVAQGQSPDYVPSTGEYSQALLEQEDYLIRSCTPTTPEEEHPHHTHLSELVWTVGQREDCSICRKEKEIGRRKEED